MLRNAAPVSAFLVSVWERCACQRILRHSVWTCALTDLKMNLHGCAALSALQLATFVGRTFVPLPLIERWMLRCLCWSSLCLSAGAAYLQLWFGDKCCCAVCAAARYDVGRSCAHLLASGSKMDVSAQSALQLAMFVGRSFLSLPLVLI